MLFLLLLCGCASVKPVAPLTVPKPIVHKQLAGNFTTPSAPGTVTMFWPDEQDTTAWIVVESDQPQGQFVYYTFTTRPWITITLTNSQHFFNYCRSQDYAP